MHLEWDEQKNAQNIHKHGLDFTHAHQVFQRPLLTTLDDREDYGEDRWMGIGMLDDTRVVVLVYVEIDEETTRVISLRKALSHERKQYQQAFRSRFGTF